MLCIGHRGARGHTPENTLSSVRKALELGVDAVEVDVYWVDGQIMVFHDYTLDRTTNGHGRIVRKSFEYLRSLDAGNGERIPTLQEVFDVVGRRALINVELKGPHTAEPVGSLIADYVSHRGWTYEDFLVSSFRRRELRKIANRPIRLGALFARSPRRFAKVAADLRAYSIHSNLRFTKPKFVRRAHERGLKVFVYTVNDPADIARMEAMGVDGVFTDFPERVSSLHEGRSA